MVDKKIYEKKIEFSPTEWFITLLFFLPIINYFLSEVLTAYEQDTLTQYFYFIIYAISVGSYFIYFAKLNGKRFFLLILISLFYFISYIFSDDVKQLIFGDVFFNSYFIIFWLRVLPPFLLLLTGVNIENLMYLFYKFSKVAIWFVLIAFYVKVFILDVNIHYMSFAYESLFTIMVCLYFSVIKKNIFYFIVSSVAAFFLLIAGCRGALVAILVFVFLLIYCDTGENIKSSRVLFMILFSILLIIAIANFIPILEFLERWLSSYGFNSRTIRKFLENDFLDDSNRHLIQEKILENLSLLPKGFYADMGEYGSYAHNWLLEVLYDFGIPLGVAVIIFVISLEIKTFFKFNQFDPMEKFIPIAAVSIVLVKFVVSSSFLLSVDFLLLIGLLINLNKSN